MKKVILLFLVVSAITAISAFTIISSNGIAGQTGSPRDGGNTCSGCHSGGATTPSVTITATPAFGTGNTYIPSTTYTISVNCSGNYPKYGFGLEILNAATASAANAGTFGTMVTANCKKLGTNPVNIMHTAATGTGNAATFSFRWMAPASGNAIIYCAINGVNNDGSTSGDKVKTTSLALTSATAGVASFDAAFFDLAVFPNPVDEYAVVQYHLEENAEVKIELYDIFGRKVSTLLNEKQPPGEYKQTWPLSPMNLKSGIYFVTISAAHRSGSQKLIIR